MASDTIIFQLALSLKFNASLRTKLMQSIRSDGQAAFKSTRMRGVVLKLHLRRMGPALKSVNFLILEFVTMLLNSEGPQEHHLF